MAMNKIIIAPDQLFCMFFISRSLSAMLYSPSLTGAINQSGSIIGMLLGMLAQLVILIPLFFLIRKRNGEDFHNILKGCLGWADKIFLILYLLYFLFAATAVLCETSYFMATFTREYDMIFYVFVFLVLTIYMAKYGLQSIARIGFVLFLCLTASFILTFVAGVTHMDYHNLAPLTSDYGNEIWEGFTRYVSGSMEMTLLPVLAPFIKTQAKGTIKASILSVVLGSLFAACTIFISSTILGVYQGLVTYPYYTALASIDLFGMRRLDVLQIYLWFMIAIVRAALFLFSGVHLAGSAFPPQKKKTVFWVLAVVVCGTALSFGRSIDSFAALSLTIRNIFVWGFFICLIPAVLLVIGSVKGRGKDAKNI